MMLRKFVFIVFLTFISAAHSQETLNLSSESTLTVDGTSTLRDWTVKANEMSGTATVESNLPKTIQFEVMVAKIKSERGAGMDKKTHNALKSGDYPKIKFTLTTATSFKLKGELEVAGHLKSVSIPVVMSHSNKGKLSIKGEHYIALKDYGIEPPTAMFGSIVVGDDVTVNFDLKFGE